MSEQKIMRLLMQYILHLIVTMKLLQEILFLLVMFNLILLEEDYSE